MEECKSVFDQYCDRPGFRRLGPDSFYLPGFVQSREAERLFAIMRDDAPWIERGSKEMKYRGHDLQRTKFFLSKGKPVIDGVYPEALFVYRYPGFQYASMLHYRTFDALPDVLPVLEQLEPIVQTTQVIGTHYLKGADTIGWHSDKMQDIKPGTFIPIVSFGAARTLELKRVEDEDDTDITSVVLEPGSLFAMGPLTNKQSKHRIPPVKGDIGPRISLVCRNIKTRLPFADVQKRIAKSIKQHTQSQERKRAKQEASVSVRHSPY
jgi:alkylated DNA repair dioxygenase AlkB